MESAITTLTHITPVFFWGVVLGNFIWVNRQAFYHKTKDYVAKLARSVVARSKRILKKRWSLRFRKKGANNEEVLGEGAQTVRQQLSNSETAESIEANRQPQITEEVSTITRKVTKPIKKHRNVRKISRNFEQCIMRRAYAKKNEESEGNQFREQMKEMDIRNWSGDVTLAKKQSLQNLEDIQKFVEEQLDNEDEQLFMLPYDPFQESEHQQNHAEQQQNRVEQQQNEAVVNQSEAEAKLAGGEPNQAS